MILTEEEARKCVCCGPAGPSMGLMLLAEVQAHRANGKRVGDIENDITCVASNCMAWRWFDSVSDDGKFCHWLPTKMVMRHPDDMKDKPLEQRRGYCGLAGKP